MFERSKVILAKNSILMELVAHRRLSKEASSLMGKIAGSPENIQYGVDILCNKIAKCKYSAAVGIFARIAVYYEQHPINGLTSYEWKEACLHGMVLAGANHEEAEDAVMGLLDMNREILSQDSLGS